VRAFDLVVFDVGGVLLRLASSWEEAHRLAGIPGPPPTDAAFHATAVALGGQTDVALPVEAFCVRVAAASEGRYSKEDVRRIHHAFLREERPGVLRVLDALDAAGIETAILSNTNDGHWARMFPPSGSPDFPAVLRVRHRFGSHLLGVVKPAAAIYEAVTKATGHAPSRVLFFDDVEANVRGARAVGWTAVRVDPDGDTAAQMLGALRTHRLLP
jgi:putative hydrolase of the HAD superfamily